MPDSLRHILCIDDEPDILEIARLCLETVGDYQVTTCVGGRDGIAQAIQSPPDLILIDVMMPDMDGPTTFRKIKDIATLEKIPVIFMTARVQKSEIDGYLKIGAAAVIAKPFDPMKLSQDIRAIWSSLRGR